MPKNLEKESNIFFQNITKKEMVEFEDELNFILK